MFSFFISFCFCDEMKIENITLDDIVFSILTSNTTSSRLEPMISTWYRDIPNLEIFSASTIPKIEKMFEGKDNIYASVNIYNQTFPDASDDWYNAQDYHSFFHNKVLKKYPDKKWYVFGDDDTFIYIDSLIEQLEKVNSSEDHIIGRSFLIPDDYRDKFSIKNKYFQFIHGGSGLCITNSLAKQVFPKYKECVDKFPFVISDLRIMLCLDAFNNVSQQYLGWKSGFNAMIPTKESPVEGPPVSFHHVVDKEAKRMWNAVHSEWVSGNNRSVVSWINYTLIDRYLPVDDTKFNFMFGYKIVKGDNREEEGFYASTPIEPVYDYSNITIVKYRQQFWNKFVDYRCTKELTPGVFHLSSRNIDETVLFELLVNCPTPKLIPHRKGAVKFNYNL